MESLAGYIRDRRLAAGMTQDDLAERSGVSQPVISDIERSRTKLPNAEARRGISRALGVRHIDVLVAAGELSPDEVPGYDATAPVPDPQMEAILHQVRNLSADDLGMLVHLLRFWGQADR